MVVSSQTSDIVTPYEVKAASKDGIDYNKLVETFGSQLITDEQLKRLEELTGKKPHQLLRRKQFFCGRDFDAILNAFEKSKETKEVPFYLYTGRGPSTSSLHVGHTVPLMFTKYLQDAFDVPLVVMLSDDEKYAAKEIEFNKLNAITRENMKDLMAIGFNPKKTYIFSNLESMSQNPNFYKLVCQIQKHVTFNQIGGIFGFDQSTNIGLISYTAVQCAPAFCGFMPEILGKNTPCLVPCAIDQDPFFRMSRDVASKIKYPKPSLLMSKFIPGLKGIGEKMSSSNQDDSAILLTDNEKTIRNKIKKYAFSGGQETAEDHKEKGGNCAVDVSYIYLTYFLEDDNELDEIYNKYTSGEMMTSDLKKRCADELVKYISGFQERRGRLTDKDIEHFTTYRDISGK